MQMLKNSGSHSTQCRQLLLCETLCLGVFVAKLTRRYWCCVKVSAPVHQQIARNGSSEISQENQLFRAHGCW